MLPWPDGDRICLTCGHVVYWGEAPLPFRKGRKAQVWRPVTPDEWDFERRFAPKRLRWRGRKPLPSPYRLSEQGDT